MNLSISIVNWNTKDILGKCLKSIYESSYRDFEVFVVDNASTDGSTEMARNCFPQVKLISNPENLGFARANNQAINSSHGKYVLILNPDVMVYKDTLEKMVDFMDAHPEAGAIGIKLVDEYGKELKKGYYRKYPSIPQTLLFYTILEKISLRYNWLKNRYWEPVDTSRVMEIQQIPGAFLLVKKGLALFDERFWLFFEDVDLCYRIKKAGWKIYLVPDITAVHIGAKSISMLTYTELATSFFNSMYLYFKKHHSLIKAQIARIIIISNTLLKITIMQFLYHLSDYKRDKRKEHIQMLWQCIKQQL